MIRRNIYTIPKGTELTGEVIAKAIKANEENLAIFTRLESYVEDAPIVERPTPNQLLAIHDFAGYIRDINVGYLVGNAVDYKATDSTNLDKLAEKYQEQDIAELDSAIAEDTSMFGQAFEAVYLDEDTEIQSSKLSVYNTIVLYDDTFKHNKIAAIYYSKYDNGNKYDLTIWTDTEVQYRTLTGKHLEEADQQDTIHPFKEVPVIHYFNNRRLKGDYESVISLIDAYNILQSDRILDREKLVDAILAFYGASNLNEKEQQALKEHRTIGLPEGAKAEYLIKNIDEADADVLRQTIAADIHKFSKTPDLTDESFGNSPSGVSILYKLLAFEQNIKKKEKQFEKGLRNRLKLYANAIDITSKAGRIDPKDIQLVFKRSLPKNNFETSQMINNLDGIVDSETLVGQLDYVDDASHVVEKAREERLELGSYGSNNAEDEE